MQTAITRRALLFAAATGLTTHTLASSSVRLIGADIPPLAAPEDGFYVDPVRRLARAAGLVQSPSWMPWARAMAEARSLGRAVVFPVARVTFTEDQWHWLAPLGHEESVLAVRRDAMEHLSELRDLSFASQLRVGVLRDCPVVPAMQQRGFTNLEYAMSNRSQARKLALGRIQAWATTRRTAEYWLTRENVDPALLWPLMVRGEVPFYLAASLDVDPAELGSFRLAGRYPEFR